MVDIYLQGAGFSWKTSEMSVSDNADVVLKKILRKILILHKVRLLEKWFRPFAVGAPGNELDL